MNLPARIGFVLAFAAPLAMAQAPHDQCLTCHQALGDEPSTLFQHDVHFRHGISCADCHGGNRNSEEVEDAMNKSAGYLGVPKGDAISAVCAGCHSSRSKMSQYGSRLPVGQLEMLSESVHGRLAISGKARIVQCTTCHNAHGIVSPKDPSSPVYPLNAPTTCAKCHAQASYMRLYDPALPVDQIEKYRTSVHGIRNAKGDPKTAQCTSCHGSHDIRSAKDAKSSVYATNLPATCAHCHSDAAYMKEYRIPTDQYEKYARSVHGVALMQKKDLGAPACNNCHGNHGATPPGVESISKVCGTCHALNADLFSASPHKRAFDERHLPECETCHGNHEIVPATEQLLGTGRGAVCGKCHMAGESSGGYQTAELMRSLSDSLLLEEGKATALVEKAEQKGMEVGEARFMLRDVHQSRLESRTMVHAFDRQRFEDVTSKGLKAAAVVSTEAQGALDEYVFRRVGLGIATLIITILAVSLHLYIRKLERKQSHASVT